MLGAGGCGAGEGKVGMLEGEGGEVDRREGKRRGGREWEREVHMSHSSGCAGRDSSY